MNKLSYDDVINRIGFFRNKANLSARETSLRLGYSEQFVKRIENKSVELKVSTLLDFLDIVGITPQDFFCLGTNYNKDDKELLEAFGALSDKNKETIMTLIKSLK